MRLVKIALANVNTTVGAVRSNTDKMIALAKEAEAAAVSLLVFPEESIGGYSPEDLVQWQSFVAAQWKELERFASETKALRAAFAVGLVVQVGACVYNCAALVHQGVILGVVPKEKLPTYNVFYEARTLSRGVPGDVRRVHCVPFGDLVFDLSFGTVAVEICEDSWSPDGPMRRRAYAGAELILNLSASPYRLGVVSTRREMISTRAADNQATVAYANLVGANDGLVFDGGGYVSQNGRLVHEAPRFTEGLTAVTVDLDRTRRLRTENTTWRDDQAAFTAAGVNVERVESDRIVGQPEKLTYPVPPNQSFFLPSETVGRSPKAAFCEDILDALALGVGDYFEKTRAFKTIGVALSGGRDSLLCLIIARRYIDRRFASLSVEEKKKKAGATLRAHFMPTRFTSEETTKAAQAAAAEFGATFSVSSIDEAFERELAEIEKMVDPIDKQPSLASQNVQARIRAERMWTWANAAGGLFLQTSNMSEKAVGYTTIGGDMEGALSVIANVPKTVVNYVLDYLLETTGSEAIRLTLAKPASAELAPGMEDEKDLMPFPVLDACFALYAGEKMAPGEVREALYVMFPKEDRKQIDEWVTKFARLFTQSIYKWVQASLCLHVGNLDLDRERALQLPVVQKTEW